MTVSPWLQVGVLGETASGRWQAQADLSLQLNAFLADCPLQVTTGVPRLKHLHDMIATGRCILLSSCCDELLCQQAFGIGQATTASSLSRGSLSLRGGAGHGEEAVPQPSTAEEGSRPSPSIMEYDAIEVCPCEYRKADPV